MNASLHELCLHSYINIIEPEISSEWGTKILLDWLLGYLKTLFQLRKLYSVKFNDRMFMIGKDIGRKR
jgi:hypothetical protein